MLDIIAALAAGLLILLIAAKLLSLPFRLLKKFIINSVIGAVHPHVARRRHLRRARRRRRARVELYLTAAGKHPPCG